MSQKLTLGAFPGDTETDSKEKIMQAKRLWNLRWCYNWYNKKCDLEKEMPRSKSQPPEDLLTTAVTIYVMQHLLQVSSEEECPPDDSLGIRETNETSLKIPMIKSKKFKLLKTSSHYIKILRDKIWRLSRRRYAKKDDFSQAEAVSDPFISPVHFSSHKQSKCMSPDLIDFVAGRHFSNLSMMHRCPCQLAISSFPEAVLVAGNWFSSDDNITLFLMNNYDSKTVDNARGVRIHSPLCIYQIVATIVKNITSLPIFLLLKKHKKENDGRSMFKCELGRKCYQLPLEKLPSERKNCQHSFSNSSIHSVAIVSSNRWTREKELGYEAMNNRELKNQWTKGNPFIAINSFQKLHFDDIFTPSSNVRHACAGNLNSKYNDYIKSRSM